jgi:site-specific recombinase XerD
MGGFMKGARALSKEEVADIRKSFCGKYEVRDRALFLIGLYTGARISELISLNVGDVWQHEKVVKTLELRKAITKGKKTRQVPLNLEARENIESLIDWKRSQGERLDPDVPLFVSRKKNGRLTRIQAHRILQAAYHENQLTGNITTHSMRKTFATMLAKNNPLQVVKELLGHSSLAVTDKYLSVTEDDLRAAVAGLSFC